MNTDIYIIAGEASGDILGANLLTDILKLNPHIKFAGIGGEEMSKIKNFKSLFNIADISVMGFIEVLQNFKTIKKRFNETITDIIKHKPKIVITIDSPSFNIRVVKKVKKYLPTTKFIHYVAPQVWAWKEKRAKKIAKIFDVLLCLFPFETPYFEKYGLKCFTVGHPTVNEIYAKTTYLSEKKDKNNTLTLSFLPGSRKQVIKKLLPIYKETIEILNEKYKNLEIFIPTTISLLPFLKTKISTWKIKPTLITGKENRFKLFTNTNIAISVAGTSIFELALFNVKTIACYKMNPISFFLAKHFVKIKTISLPNIITKNNFIPELIQNNVTPKNINQEIEKFLNDKTVISNYKNNISKMQNILKQNIAQETKIAKIILNYLK